MSWYPMMAAKNTPEIDENFISTDDKKLIDLGKSIGFQVIKRPEHLASKEALGEDAYKHGYEVICNRIGKGGSQKMMTTH